jgi:hypothetical protein
MNIPPPQQNQAPTHTTQLNGPTTLNLGPVSVPAASQQQQAAAPGYQQNIHAQELSSAQRSSLEEQERKESAFANVGGDIAGETAGSVWSTVQGWVGAAGKGLAEAEEKVWKGINGR